MEKNSIKENFRNGSRPTQEHFYALIDACYNEDTYAVCLSGYNVMPDIGEDETVKYLQRRAGQTTLVPWFKRINIPQQRVYTYHIPCCNLGPDILLQKIALHLQLPESKTYEVTDEGGAVKISQTIAVESISFYNGGEILQAFDAKDIPADIHKVFSIKKNIGKWRGISVDIVIAYDIKSKIAVSDQFDLTRSNAKELEHVFGGLECEFIKMNT